MEPKAVYIPGGCGARQSTGSRPAPRILFSFFLTGEPLQDLNRKKRSQEFPWLLFFSETAVKAAGTRASEIFVSQFSENNLFILTPAFNISSTIHI